MGTASASGVLVDQPISGRTPSLVIKAKSTHKSHRYLQLPQPSPPGLHNPPQPTATLEATGKAGRQFLPRGSSQPLPASPWKEREGWMQLQPQFTWQLLSPPPPTTSTPKESTGNQTVNLAMPASCLSVSCSWWEWGLYSKVKPFGKNESSFPYSI